MKLRNKYNKLKQKHRYFKSLLKETGMGYNTMIGQVSATDEVWDRLIRVKIISNEFIAYFILIVIGIFYHYNFC